MANNRPMTEDEKKLLQAQHRMEAIEARNRQKERKARTRRLIQMGAVLESVFPEVQTMELDDVKMELKRRLRHKPWQLRCYPEGRTYSPPIKWAVVSPSGSCALRGFAAPLEPYVQCHTCCHCPRSFRKYKRYCVCNQGYKLYPTLR